MNLTLPSKITAFIFGLVCIAVAFSGKKASKINQTFSQKLIVAAQFLGGLIQASFTVFGAVGGPLFGLFTLGMFTRSGNQRVNSFLHGIS